MTNTTESKTDRIRELNDAFRRTFVGGAVMITPASKPCRSINAARSYRRSGASTPSARTMIRISEHDFGSIDEAGVRCFWKIDYYDRKTEFGSPDPADPAVTTRVLTIMLAEEY